MSDSSDIGNWLNRIFLQVFNNGTLLPIQPGLNFKPPFTVIDNPSTQRTDVTVDGLPTSIPTSLFTSPPLASNWVSLYGSPTSPTNLYPGVQFTQSVGADSTFLKTLASPGGAHTATFFLNPQMMLSSNASVNNVGVVIGGSTKFVTTYYGNVGSVTQHRMLRFLNNGSFDAGIDSAPDTVAIPFGPGTWKLTFDNTNLTAEHLPLGGIWTTVSGPFAHGCGSISKVGLRLQSDSNILGCSLLSYVET